MSERKVRLRNHVGFALAVLILLADPVPSAQANGCSYVHATPTPSISERTTAAPIVLEGIVTTLSGSDAQAVAGVQVYQYLKGSGPSLVYISGFHKRWTLYECEDWVNVGDHLIFYAGRVPESGKLHAFVVGARGSTTPASSDYLEEAMLVAGQRPVTPYPETEVPPATETLTPSAAADGSGPVTPASTSARTRISSTLATILLMVSGVTATVAIILLSRSIYVQRKKQD